MLLSTLICPVQRAFIHTRLLQLNARRDHVLTQTFVFLGEGGTFARVLTPLAAPPCHIYTRLLSVA